MKKVVEIKFDDEDKKYIFDSNNINFIKGDYVICNSEKGIRFGQAISSIYEVDDDDIGLDLDIVLRKADSKDIKTNEKNKQESIEALNDARLISESLDLNMRIIDSNFNFDRSQLLFHFLSDNRVDFRELAKKLAQKYHTRIELRQIGVRDKAKMVGGLGPCGRFLCCSTFLTDFNSVSINMAKNQMLALNPTKINGICGRLLCCLGYEDEIYTEIKNDLPSIGQTFKNDDVEGIVLSLNILKKTITVETKNKSIVEVQV